MSACRCGVGERWSPRVANATMGGGARGLLTPAAVVHRDDEEAEGPADRDNTGGTAADEVGPPWADRSNPGRDDDHRSRAGRGEDC